MVDKSQRTLNAALHFIADLRRQVLETDDASDWKNAKEVFWHLCRSDAQKYITEIALMLVYWRCDRVPDDQRKNEACAWLRGVAETLIIKNDAYGAAISDPMNVFCKLSAIEQCASRVDAKLSRLKYGSGSMDAEDTKLDLMGYLALLAGLVTVGDNLLLKYETEVLQ